MPGEVRIGSQVIGGSVVPVIAGPKAMADVVRYRTGDSGDDLGRLTPTDVPLLVEPHAVPIISAALSHAAAFLVDADDTAVLHAVTETNGPGLPVIVRRGGVSSDAWLAAARRGERNGVPTMLCDRDLVSLHEIREQVDTPVIADLTGNATLGGAAVAAGADALLLSEDADEAVVTRARETADRLGSLVRSSSAITLGQAREAIDRIDATLATLLEYRAEMVVDVQGLKTVGGFAGRDPDREQEIIEAMALRAPRLGPERLRRIMTAVIEASLDLAEAEDRRAHNAGPKDAEAGSGRGRSVADPAVRGAG